MGAIRVDEEYLKEIGILEPYKKNVDRTPVLNVRGDDIEIKANLILKSLIKKQPKSPIAATLASTAKQLKLQQTKDSLKHKLDAVNKEHPVIQGIDGSVAPSLVANKKKLETAQKADIINQSLAKRGNADEIGLDFKISPAIQSIAKSLQSKMRRHSLKKKVSARPDKIELIDSGILKPFSVRIANSLQLNASELETALAHQVSKEYLREIGVLEPYKKNVDSTKLDIEKSAGLLLRALVDNKIEKKSDGTAFGYADIAPSLQQTAKSLDTKQKKDKLSQKLENRPSSEDVMERHSGSLGYRVNAAPSLQQTIKELGREMIKDFVNKLLKNRPLPNDIGVDTKTAPIIQSKVNQLNMAKKRDSISTKMKQRPSAKDAGIDTNLARGLQGIAKTLEMEMKSDKIDKKLTELGIVKKVRTEGILTSIDQLIQFIEDYKL